MVVPDAPTSRRRGDPDRDLLPTGIRDVETGVMTPWADLDDLAARDGIVPPTGEALRDVLFGMHKIPGPTPAQIIRWAGEPV